MNNSRGNIYSDVINGYIQGISQEAILREEVPNTALVPVKCLLPEHQPIFSNELL
jgi:hypothetical protein